MPDLLNDPLFRSAVYAARSGIESLADFNVPDAMRLIERRDGENSLQAHYHSVVPLAVLLARLYPHLLQHIRSRTDLMHDMGLHSREARDLGTWSAVQERAKLVIATRGTDPIAKEMKSEAVQDVAQVAETYLSDSYGGAYEGGGRGDTVLKRTLKLMAHMAIEL